MNGRALRRAASTSATRVIAAPPGLIVIGGFYVMATSVLSGLWSSAAEAGNGTIAGYSGVALVWYIATAEASVIPIPIRLIDDIGDDIGTGRIGSELHRPISMLWLRLASVCGETVPRMLVCVSLGLVIASLFGGRPPDASALLLAGPALVLALALNLVGQHVFAGAAFWVRDAKGAWFLYQKFVFVVGGMLLPIEIFPSWLEAAARFLPFMAMAYVPARLASGHFEPQLLLLQLFWLVVLSIAATRLFAAGERRFVEVGG